MSFSLRAAGHKGLGFAYNVENPICSLVTCKLCNSIIFINAESYLCGSLLLKC